MRCRGICDSIPTFNRYVKDSRFCKICGRHLYIKNIGLRCPCCHAMYRKTARTRTVSLLKRRELLHRY